MYELTVVGFKKDMFRASTVLNKLIELNFDWAVDLSDAVAVYRDYNGELRVDESLQMTTGEGAAWGTLWGTLIGTVLAIPFTAGASAAVAGTAIATGALGGGMLGAAGGALDARWWKEDFGISEDFVGQVSHLIELGDSAIFALIRTYDPAYVAEQFRGYGGTVLRTSLTKEQSDKVQAALEGKVKA